MGNYCRIKRAIVMSCLALALPAFLIAQDDGYTGTAEQGQVTYEKFCKVCHDQGVGGAPLLSDQARWQTSAEKGQTILLEHVEQGFQGSSGYMPPKGTCVMCSSADFKDAIRYMLETAKVIDESGQVKPSE